MTGIPSDVAGAGILCPGCGDKKQSVTHTARVRDALRRRRTCLKCRERFFTYEVAAPAGVEALHRRLGHRDRLEALTIKQRHLIESLIQELRSPMCGSFVQCKIMTSICYKGRAPLPIPDR